MIVHVFSEYKLCQYCFFWIKNFFWHAFFTYKFSKIILWKLVPLKNINIEASSIKKGVLKYFTSFTEKQLCWSLLFTSLKAVNFIKKRLQHRCLPVKSLKFWRTSANGCFCKCVELLLISGFRASTIRFRHA